MLFTRWPFRPLAAGLLMVMISVGVDLIVVGKEYAMRRTMMVVCLMGFLIGVDCSIARGDTVGSLKIEKKTATKKAVEEIVAYSPREGDLIFFDDHNWMWTLLFAWAGTGPPLHMGIAVKKADGSLAVLEAGPDDTVWVTLQDLDKRLHQFRDDYQGTITIRRCKKELTREESAALTKFAKAQDGKRYAVGRLLLEGTWFRSRGPIRELVLGKTYLDRDSWICSELAVAAGTVVKLFDPAVVRANVTYPRDLVDNRRHDLSGNWHDPAEWQPSPKQEANEKK
jgi:hypothetical protein